MKKQKMTQTELCEIINSMEPEQFEMFVKENNREINQLAHWSQGEDFHSKSAFRIAHEIMQQVVIVEELSAICSDDPSSLELHERLALETNKLQIIFDDLENKADSFAAVIKLMEKDVEKYESLAEICKRKAKSIDLQIDGIKNRIVVLMQGLDIPKIKGTFFTLTVGKPTKSVMTNDFTDEELETIDSKFVAVKKSLDKKAVKEALENGEVLAWATLKEKQGLRIS